MIRWWVHRGAEQPLQGAQACPSSTRCGGVREQGDPLHLQRPAQDRPYRTAGAGQKRQDHRRCMIQANVAAARYIRRTRPPPCFRVHDRPGERLTGFRDFLAELGLGSRGLGPGERTLPTLAAKFEGRPDAELLPPCCCAPMRPAIYQADSIGHFGSPGVLRSLHLADPSLPGSHPAPGDQVPDRQGAAGQPTSQVDAERCYRYQLEEVDPWATLLHDGAPCRSTTRDVADWLKCSTCWITWVTSLTASSPASPVLASSCVWRRSHRRSGASALPSPTTTTSSTRCTSS